MRRLLRFRLLVATLLAAAGLAGLARAAPSQAPVIVVPIHGTVDDGMAHLVQRAMTEAQDAGAAAVVLDIDSPGGVVAPALEIRDAILNSHTPTIAYVSERAYSAAALIALSAQHLIMAPGASIGAAEPIPGTAKNISALSAEFQSTALRNHRDAHVAAAMVDKTVDLPEYKKPGAVLSLNTNDALRAGISESTRPTLEDALKTQGLQDAPQRGVDYTFAESLARFATNPEVSGILLTLGVLGLLIEMQTLHGIAGVIGVGALALFFGSHIYAGFSNGFVVVLAVLGLVGILYELHVVPGHGVPGILGAIALFAAILLAFGIPFFFIALQSISTAIVLTIVLFYAATKIWPENAWMHRIAFVSVQGPEYVASRDNTSLLGHVGSASSYLRPAGVALVNGQRIDVLTEGEFIPAGTPVRVTRVEGARVFVEPVNLPDYKE
ncbi:MAG: ATP-dependent Clp protease proteolytic subunit [Candidatus Eremiobacteraeota bacterium]|nr:ATP-dependent Clp protease proteolytic subunit [Candidatus Eremiobacteraeota bacterium]